MNNQPIRFLHRGTVVSVSGVHPTRTVLDWLREDAHCSGTKEGCNEGDCGACTVVIGELTVDVTGAPPIGGASAPATASAAAPSGGNGAAWAESRVETPAAAVADPVGDAPHRGLKLRTVNACIQFLPTLHGKALFTVEDLKVQAAAAAAAARQAADRDGDPDAAAAASAAVGRPPTRHRSDPGRALHPVQQAMVDCHGSQCGFCTPGFVMSLWSTYEVHRARGSRPTRQQLADDLSGNLCRCTGYRPIIDAGQRMFELPPVALDTAPVIAALAALETATAEHGDDGFSYAAPNLQVVDAAGAPRVDAFHAPRTLAALAACRAAHPEATLLAGCTDIGLWTNKQFRDLVDIVYVGEVAELKAVGLRDTRAAAGDGRQPIDADELFIGAGASLEAAFAALAQRLPALTDVWLRFASPPIRNAGTLGGSVANGSPIGDAAPLLMALDALIELRHGDRVRRLPLSAFYVGYMRNRLEPGEFVQGLALPLAALRRDVRAYKISKRFDCDISALCGGLAVARDAGDAVTAVRIAFGGLAATVKRAAHAEAALHGRPWTQASIGAAQAALADDFQPLTDMRASAGYRLRVAQNLLQRFWLETRAVDPLAAHATSVWSVMPHHSGSAAPPATRGRIDLPAV